MAYNVLLLGDSIRIGYDSYVATELGAAANVYYPNENCARTIEGIDRIGHGAWINASMRLDMVCFNHGLHDARVSGLGNPYTPINDYAPNMQIVIDMLRTRAPNALLSFMETTWVVTALAEPARTEANQALYKAELDSTFWAANPDIELCDLWTPTRDNVGTWGSGDGVHYTSAGSEAIGAIVAAHIADRLGIA